jgi:hypothetical protein
MRKKQTMIDLRGISSNWFKNQFFPSKRLSIGYGLRSTVVYLDMHILVLHENVEYKDDVYETFLLLSLLKEH